MKETLQKFGLTDKEATVYLAMLELGTAPVSDIAAKSDLNRSTTYVILDDLSSRGMVSSTDKNKIRVFTPASPERLVHYLNEKAKHYESLVGVANSVMPELKSMYVGAGPKPTVQFFEGKEGVQHGYEETLKSTEEIRAFASIDDMHSTLPRFFPEYYQRRANKNIHIKAIFPDTPAARERISNNKQEKRTAYLVPKDSYYSNSEINVYDDKIVFLALKEHFSLIIHSETMANVLKKIFDLAFIEAERLHHKIKK